MLAARKFLALTAVAAGLAVLPAAAPAGPRIAEVSFVSHGERLHGAVFTPPGDGRDRPGVVLVTSSGGAWPRDQVRGMVEPLVRSGVAVLVYDKRTEGYSPVTRSYARLADDALMAVRTLRARPGIDPDLVGLWGVSEGGWIAPLAAAASEDVAFLVLLAASGVPPARQTAWHLTNALRGAGVSGDVAEALPVKAVRLVTGLGQFPEAGHDPVPPLERVRQPVLAVWGGRDVTVPPAESMTVVRDALDRADNDRYALRVFPDAGHPLTGPARGAGTTWIVEEFFHLVGAWVDDLSGPAAAPAVDPPPRQDRQTGTVATQAWYESPWAQGGALVWFLVAFLGYPVVGLARRLRRREPPVVARPARLLAVTGLLAPLGLTGYLVVLLLTQRAGGAVAGLSVPITALRLLTVAAAAAAVALAVTWWRRRQEVRTGERVRLGLLLGGAAVLVPWAAYWGLLW